MLQTVDKPYTSRIGLLNLSRSVALFSAPAGLGLTNLARLVLGYFSKMNFVSNLGLLINTPKVRLNLGIFIYTAKTNPILPRFHHVVYIHSPHIRHNPFHRAYRKYIDS